MNAELISKALQQDEASVHELLARGANPNCRDSDGSTPLFQVVLEKNTNLVSTLPAYGADISATENRSGSTPLIIAASAGFVDGVRILLTEGASVNDADSEGHTALHIATAYNFGAVVDVLLAHNASPDIPDGEGKTPLHAAASYYHQSPTAINPNARRTDKSHDHNWTALDNFPGNGHNAIFSALLKNSSRPDMRDNSGSTPLHLAARDGYQKAVCQLLAVTAELDITDHEGQTPLHRAAAGGHSAVISMLQKHGFQPDCKDNKGNTPLHLAARSGRFEAVREMLTTSLLTSCDHGCAVLDNVPGHSPISSVPLKHCYLPDMCNNKGNTPLHLAAADGHLEAVCQLLAVTAEPDSANHNGRTPLHVAAAAGHSTVISLLLKHGLQPDCKDNKDNTPLHLAVKSRSFGAVQEMLAAPLKANAINFHGHTPLHLAIREGRVEMAKALLINGADPNIRSTRFGSYGETALHFATSRNRSECIDLLLANGARTDIKDNLGFTPLAEKKDKAIINKLTNPPLRYLQPQSLQSSCRAAIRTRLVANHPRQPLSASIDKLDCLPRIMKVYLYSALIL